MFVEINNQMLSVMFYSLMDILGPIFNVGFCGQIYQYQAGFLAATAASSFHYQLTVFPLLLSSIISRSLASDFGRSLHGKVKMIGNEIC
jgi:hypothetical protein